jgi:subtilisin family serine protease
VAVNDFVFNSGNPYQYHDHGTEVLSCIAANYQDFKGTAYDATFVLAVTEDVRSEFRIEEYNWLLAAEFADSVGVDIIHSSLGYSVFGKEPSMNYTYEDLDGNTATITQAVNLARDRGILVVTSAGNEGNSDWKYITAPADARGILTVGAVREDYTRASFSSVGPTADGRIKPDVMALGSGTAVMFGNGGISQSNGTSYAAPLVAGLAAGLWQANPDWTNIDVINAIKYTSSRALNPDAQFGYGIPDFTVAREGAVLSVDQIINRDISVYPNPFKDNKIFIDTRRLMDSGSIQLTLFDQQGKVVVTEIVNSPKERITLEIPGIKAGPYVLKIHSEAFSKTVKLIKY